MSYADVSELKKECAAQEKRILDLELEMGELIAHINTITDACNTLTERVKVLEDKNDGKQKLIMN